MPISFKIRYNVLLCGMVDLVSLFNDISALHGLFKVEISYICKCFIITIFLM